MSWTLEMERRFTHGRVCPAGAWEGAWYQDGVPSPMSLRLTFGATCMDGTGRDSVGRFEIVGRYLSWNGLCLFTKMYDAGGDVFYSGMYDGDKIEGEWLQVWNAADEEGPEVLMLDVGRFVIWPLDGTDLPLPLVRPPGARRWHRGPGEGARPGSASSRTELRKQLLLRIRELLSEHRR